jgi:trans-2,3-dihydro-3-hydroxyanthranilate isomerase
MTAYRVYDVFTDRAFGGNQLAVFPDAEALPQGQLQAIAAEFNFSEVTFVYPPADPDHAARVRIFTPTQEVAFAGHPTIGTAICLRDLGFPPAMVLELGVGPIPCTVVDGIAGFTASQPLQVLSYPDPALVAQCLDLPVDTIDPAAPPVQASLGLPFVLVRLTDRAALTACTPVIDALKKAAALHPSGRDFAIFAYLRDEDGRGARIDARMFAPLDNIPEDPATGSAAATLARILARDEGDIALTVHQGADMGRPSLIRAVVKGEAVTISGSAVLVMEGHLVL